MTDFQLMLFDGRNDETSLRAEQPQSLDHAKVVELDPSRVSIWSGNGRTYENLTEERCRDLIDSILSTGGQQIPVLVRPVTGDDRHDFELMVGTRRHWAISWLTAHDQPGFALRAIICPIPDERAFLLADLENRARTDISALERARSYEDALARYYWGGVKPRWRNGSASPNPGSRGISPSPTCLGI